MKETEWTKMIKRLLLSEELGEGIHLDVEAKVPYSNEVLSYNLDGSANITTMEFSTDLLIYEKVDKIKPRVIIESKINSVTTHDAITYSNKALSHKQVIPYVRYGIMLGNRKHYPLPGRLFRHGQNFDFMISFEDFILNDIEKESFLNLIKLEIDNSKKVEEFLYNSRKQDRNKYYYMHKSLTLK